MQSDPLWTVYIEGAIHKKETSKKQLKLRYLQTGWIFFHMKPKTLYQIGELNLVMLSIFEPKV